MTHKIATINGDGIGNEVIPLAKKVLMDLEIDMEFVEAEAGYDCYQTNGTPLPNDTLDIINDCNAILFGAVTTPPNIPNYKSPILSIRQELDLFANIRPVINDNINLVIIRENSEGLYAGREYIQDDGTIISERITTFRGSQRILDFAFKYATDNNRHWITLVHKANILRKADGLLRELFFKYDTDIEKREMLVDAAALKLLTNPSEFDVIVTTNMFGDILSDEASWYIGGLGMAASANIGLEKALFEPVHGSAPDIAGKNTANPFATLYASGMMLDWLGETESAIVLRDVIQEAINENLTTPDLGGKYSTSIVGESLCTKIKQKCREL